jgi:hypothetical protein
VEAEIQRKYDQSGGAEGASKTVLGTKISTLSEKELEFLPNSFLNYLENPMHNCHYLEGRNSRKRWPLRSPPSGRSKHRHVTATQITGLPVLKVTSRLSLRYLARLSVSQLYTSDMETALNRLQ